MKEISDGPSDKRSQELCRTRASFFFQTNSLFSVFGFVPFHAPDFFEDLSFSCSCCSMFLHFGPGESTEDSL